MDGVPARAIVTPPESPPPPTPPLPSADAEKRPQSAAEAAREKRRSLEDFLKIGLGEEDGGDKSIVPLPPPATTVARKVQVVRAAKVFKLGTGKTGQNPYEGSVDYWEQYDPEEVAQHGQGVVTTDRMDGVQALCFLCGSAGTEQVKRFHSIIMHFSLQFLFSENMNYEQLSSLQ